MVAVITNHKNVELTCEDVDPLSPSFKIAIEDLLLTFDKIGDSGLYCSGDISKEKTRVENTCEALYIREIGIHELHLLLNFPALMNLCQKEPELRMIMDELQIFHRLAGTHKYIAPTQKELEMMKLFLGGLGRFTAGAWMHLAFLTDLKDGVDLGWSTLDYIFRAKNLTPTNPDSWFLDLFI